MFVRYSVLTGVILLAGCQKYADTQSTQETAVLANSEQMVNQIVSASCGECQFGMEGSGCDLAIKIDDKQYFVDGSTLDEHGDAHAEDGLCNCVRKATVSGEIVDGRFIASEFALLPNEN